MSLSGQTSQVLISFDRKKSLSAFGGGFVVISMIYMCLAVVVYRIMRPDSFILNNLLPFIAFTIIGAGLCVYMLPIYFASAFVFIQSIFSSPPAIFIIERKLVYISPLYLTVPLDDIEMVDTEVTGRSKWGNIRLGVKNGKTRRISLAGISLNENDVILKIVNTKYSEILEK